MCVQYTGGVQNIGGISRVHRGHIMSTSGDIMSTLGDVQYIGGYHDACGGYHEYTRKLGPYFRTLVLTSYCTKSKLG